MKNVFNEADKNEILQRTEKLTPETKAVWGTMNVAQMLAHCAYAVQMPTGEVPTKRVGFPLSFIGGLLKSKMLGEGALPKNSPTATEIKVTDERDFQKEKANFIAAFKKLTEGGENGVKATHHPFFGKITPKEWGRLNYKHIDHHLKQFGV
ncbi:MAG: DUF1569 domain-containing protein [Bacteroidia bacterium]